MKYAGSHAIPARRRDMRLTPLALDRHAVASTVDVQDRNAVGWLERSIAGLLLAVAAPVVGLLSLWVALTDGRPVFYRGERLGYRRSVFHMYKVRTLRRGAEGLTGGRLLSASDRLEIPGGRWMRDGRLDELPQLWNVVRGDMRFVGPRPERSSVFRSMCLNLPGYARRFDVRPGIVGPSQLFTPHSTPKRIRSWLDNAWAKRVHPVRSLVGLTLYTAITVAMKAFTRGHESLVEILRCRLMTGRRDERRLRRVRFSTARARLFPLDARLPAVSARLLDMNERSMRVCAPPGVDEGMRVRVHLEVELQGRSGRCSLRRADCSAHVARRRADSLVLDYAPETPRSSYVLHQYFLRESLAAHGERERPCRRPLAPPAPIADVVPLPRCGERTIPYGVDEPALRHPVARSSIPSCGERHADHASTSPDRTRTGGD